MLLIGSRAACLRWPDFYRKAVDYDFIGTKDEIENFISKVSPDKVEYKSNNKIIAFKDKQIFEFDVALEGSTTKEIYDYCKSDPASIKTEDGFILPSGEVLLMLKESHKFRKNSPHFLKTMRDIRWIRNKEILMNFNLIDILVSREEETYNYVHPKLNTNKKTFFTDSVNYVYDHDSIHKAIALLDEPAYRKYMKDGEEVMCDRSKFDRLPEFVKLCGVYEETCVLALERCLVPFEFKTHPKQAFLMALSKVCTSITSGWFRKYAWENYDSVVAMYGTVPNYVWKFNKGLEKGIVLPFSG